MRKAFLLFCACLFTSCNSAPPVVNSNTTAAATPGRSEKTETAIAHTTENQMAPVNNDSSPGSKSKWTQSGDPIDTSEYDAEITKAEKALKSKPDDTNAKKALSDSYYKRADALTKARQYAAALGDYRRSLKLDPDNAQAKEWIDQIISIYDSLGRESPPEGQEPPPLPYKPEK